MFREDRIMAHIGKKIKAARMAKKLTQQQLCDALGWDNHSRIGMYERGEREPKSKVIKMIASVTGYPVEWFYSDDEIDKKESTYTSPSLPLVSFSELANLDDNKESFEHIELHKPDSFAVKIESDSMLSGVGVSFPEGSIVIVYPYKNPLNGDYVIAELEDNVIVFRQLILEGAQRYLRALNPSWKPIDMSDRVKIIGVVVSSIMQFQ
jgi:SOS-response transcriptional repressor LexA